MPITTILGLDQGCLWLIYRVYIVSFLRRSIYTIIEKVRCMRIEAHLPEALARSLQSSGISA